MAYGGKYINSASSEGMGSKLLANRINIKITGSVSSSWQCDKKMPEAVFVCVWNGQFSHRYGYLIMFLHEWFKVFISIYIYIQVLKLLYHMKTSIESKIF